MVENLRCSSCFAEIGWPATMWKGEPYCCDGCVMGGPCVCTYEGPPPKLDISRILASIGIEIALDSASSESKAIECENCFEPLNRSPYYHEGKPYCCAGCADGGPCICTYGNPQPERRSQVKFTDDGTGSAVKKSQSSMRRSNSLWAASGQNGDSQTPELDRTARANSLWSGQDKPAASRTAANLTPKATEPEQTAPVEQAQPKTAEPPASPAARERFQISVSPLIEVRDVRRFMTQLEGTPSVLEVMLMHYAGDHASFEVRASSTMAVIKDIMDMDALAVSSLRMVSDGLELVLTPDEVEEPRVQVSAKELVAAAVQEHSQPENPTQAETVQFREPSQSNPRTGDEGELHSFKFEMGVDVFFNGRHQVEVGGVKGPVHMHSWRVQAILEGESASESGQIVGSRDVREVISSLITPWNDKMLNREPPFDEIMPTANNIARYIYDHVSGHLIDKSARLKSVRLWESPTSYVEYAGEGYGAL